jgi:hypothetical protein
LPRSFVAAAADPAARIAVRVEELPEPGPGVLLVHFVPAYRAQNGPDAIAEALAAGERVVVSADARTAIAAAHANGHTVVPDETIPPTDAVLAVAGVTEAEALAVETLPAERVPKRLRKAARAGATRGVVGVDLGTPREQYIPWRAGETLEIPGARGRTATLALVQD